MVKGIFGGKKKEKDCTANLQGLARMSCEFGGAGDQSMSSVSIDALFLFTLKKPLT